MDRAFWFVLGFLSPLAARELAKKLNVKVEFTYTNRRKERREYDRKFVDIIEHME